MKALAHPRWEDFEYEYVSDNPCGWLGDGWTEDEKNKTINVDYLDDDQIDFPTPVVGSLDGVVSQNGGNPNGVDDSVVNGTNGTKTNGVH